MVFYVDSLKIEWGSIVDLVLQVSCQVSLRVC